MLTMADVSQIRNKTERVRPVTLSKKRDPPKTTGTQVTQVKFESNVQSIHHARENTNFLNNFLCFDTQFAHATNRLRKSERINA